MISVIDIWISILIISVSVVYSISQITKKSSSVLCPLAMLQRFTDAEVDKEVLDNLADVEDTKDKVQQALTSSPRYLGYLST